MIEALQANPVLANNATAVKGELDMTPQGGSKFGDSSPTIAFLDTQTTLVRQFPGLSDDQGHIFQGTAWRSSLKLARCKATRLDFALLP